VKTLVAKLQEKVAEDRTREKIENQLQLKVIEQRLKSIEETLKSVVNIEWLQDDRIRDMNKMFSIYVKYIHNLDISPGKKKEI